MEHVDIASKSGNRLAESMLLWLATDIGIDEPKDPNK